MGTTVRQLRTRSGVLMMLGACMLAMTLAMFAVPSPARADEAGGAHPLVVSQSFSKTGEVPQGLGETFSYELGCVTADAPLPKGAQGDTYSFSLDGNGSRTFGLVAGGVDPADGIAYDRPGDYDYELRCTSDASTVEGLEVDGTVWAIRVRVESDASGGLRVAAMTVKNLSTGHKPDAIAFEHRYAGQTAPQAAPREGAGDAPSVFGIKLPRAGDATWGLIQLSLVVCVVGVVLVVMGVRRRIRHRQGR